MVQLKKTQIHKFSSISEVTEPYSLKPGSWLPLIRPDSCLKQHTPPDPRQSGEEP